MLWEASRFYIIAKPWHREVYFWAHQCPSHVKCISKKTCSHQEKSKQLTQTCYKFFFKNPLQNISILCDNVVKSTYARQNKIHLTCSYLSLTNNIGTTIQNVFDNLYDKASLHVPWVHSFPWVYLFYFNFFTWPVVIFIKNKHCLTTSTKS